VKARLGFPLQALLAAKLQNLSELCLGCVGIRPTRTEHFQPSAEKHPSGNQNSFGTAGKLPSPLIYIRPA